MAARRLLARQSVADFACMVDIPTVPLSEEDDEDQFSVMRLDSLVAHHQLICEALNDIAFGRCPNLMLLLPPGSAKSTYVDVVFIPWFMGKFPRRNVILGSYGTTIARKQGRRARQLVRSSSYSALMGVGLSKATTAAEEWALTNGSEFMGGGLLSGITGNRAHLGIIDDPIAGREEAESATIRDKTWDAYIDDFCSRLVPGAPQVMVTTRWHQDDPAGRILPEKWNGESGMIDGRDGRRWRVICLPAEAEHADDPLGRAYGEVLWPQWFTPGHFEPFKRNRRTWTSLYQQRPSPDEGTFFQKTWFHRYKLADLPRRLRKYGTSDYAVTEDGGDFTVHRIWGIDAAGDIWLLPGGYRGQSNSATWIGEKVSLIKAHMPFAWFGEGGAIQKAIEPALLRAMKEASVRCRLEWLPSITDKPTRARGFQSRAATGTVHIPDGPEGDAILDEYIRFPAGKHDDDVDNGSLLGRALDMAHPALVEPEKDPEKPILGINDMTLDQVIAMQPKQEEWI